MFNIPLCFYDFWKEEYNYREIDYACQTRERCHISCHSLSRCIRNTHAAALTSFLKCKVNENLDRVTVLITGNMSLQSVKRVLILLLSLLALNTLHGFRLSQVKDWHRETIVANQKSPWLLHDASFLSGTAKNRAVCFRLKNWELCYQKRFFTFNLSLMRNACDEHF